jgi:16S rRNA (guanine527-N7)-methyltransferase
MDRSESLADAVAQVLRLHLQPGATTWLPSGGAPDPWPAGLVDELAGFCAVLAAANKRLNLTGITDPQGLAVRHVLDSLTALPLLDGVSSLMDLGSGGGLPGIPLAMARPSLRVTLVESRQRKAAALVGIVDQLGLGPRVDVACERGERWLVDHAVDAVVTRAAGPAAEVLARLSAVRQRFGRLILMKGPRGDEELAALGTRLAGWGFSTVRRAVATLPDGAGRRVLLQLDPLTAGRR